MALAFPREKPWAFPASRPLNFRENLPMLFLALFAGIVRWPSNKRAWPFVRRSSQRAMKRKTRKSGKKVPMLWDETMDFEVAIRPLIEAETDPELAEKIIMLPLPNMRQRFPHKPPPLAA